MVELADYAVGDEVFGPSNPSELTYRILDGYVRLYRILPNGRSINMALLGPGEFFSQVAVSDGDDRCVAEAIAPARLEQFAFDAASSLSSCSEERDRGMIASQARQIAMLHVLVEQLLARDTGVRLATTLLDLAGGFGAERPDGRVAILLPITHQWLANMIGSNRVTVTRKLIELSQANAVSTEGRSTLVVDPHLLRLLAAN
ncbi:MAG TPA: Crp/Fnr family transcriptional regulator [Thermomicrobiales bacterium]|nr:Crp/Fnr family transcriptional regulator [Thermomicrobiales bacterium]